VENWIFRGYCIYCGGEMLQEKNSGKWWNNNEYNCGGCELKEEPRKGGGNEVDSR